MMYRLTVLLALLFLQTAFSQTKPGQNGRASLNPDRKNKVRTTESDSVRSLRGSSNKDKIATIDQYRILTLDRDTTFVDTTLTIKKEYAFNYLRKDTYGLLPFANEAQTYLTLDKSLSKKRFLPGPGYTAKMFAFLHPEDIRYYSVATPFTELYFKTTMEQGQSVDALVAVNVKPNFNFSLAYKGVRSLGKYINQLSSTGSFRATFNYQTTSKRYVVFGHFMSFDFLNGENGGLINVSDFESEDTRFDNRARLDVFMRDAKSFLKGKRLFLDHAFRINSGEKSNNLSVFHQLDYETRFYEYNQANVVTALGGNEYLYRFGTPYVTSGINDQARYNKFYNKAGVEFENKTIGHFKAFVEDFRFNYYFGRILITDGVVNDGSLSGESQSVGGTYFYKKGRWAGEATLSNSIAGESMSNFNAQASFAINDKNRLRLSYLRQSSIPDHIYNMHQSRYASYNWVNDFRNEKLNTISGTVETQWVNASAYISNINDKLYFFNNTEAATDPRQQIVAPAQYGKSIQYINIKADKEIRWWKLGLDNTLLYQQVQQDDPIMNVPKFTTRNALYFHDHFFKKALYIQTGFIFNYFTKFYADDFNPVLNEFFVQTDKEIGGYPMFDFFINAKIKTCRIYFKAEHFNSAWTGNDYLTATNYPYRDFVIRFGLEWNFFK